MVSTDGTEIAWASIGDKTAADGSPYLPNIAAIIPGREAEPSLVYQSRESDSTLWPIAVRHGHYAFLESNHRLLGDSGWRLWSLAARNGVPVLLDHGDTADGTPTPQFALSDAGLVWTVVHQLGNMPTFELRSASADGSDQRVLQSAPEAKQQYWTPSGDPAGTIFYSTVESVSGTWQFRAWQIDPRNGTTSAPVRVGTSDAATDPVSNGQLVAWKIADNNVSNWGAGMEIADLGASTSRPTPVIHETNLSIGNRYVAFDSLDDSTDLRLYDTTSNRIVTIEYTTRMVHGACSAAGPSSPEISSCSGGSTTKGSVAPPTTHPRSRGLSFPAIPDNLRNTLSGGV